MTTWSIVCGMVLLSFFIGGISAAGEAPATQPIMPVTPNASPEAVALLQFLHDISGKKILTGQHCNPLLGSIRLGSVYKLTNHYPALFGQDFGFSEPGTWDGINYRQQIVDEAIRRHEEGFIITIMWHAVRPIEDEPVEFQKSIEGKLTDQEWQDLVTPGTEINERWKSQVDVIAWHLRQLRDAGVPVLWRPYHEMNGGWFWWGKKPGENGYKKLYRMLYDRLVNFHKLNNLIWVYDCNELNTNVDPYETYYPGDDVVDVLATDVYRMEFAKNDYDSLLALAGDKPIALGEVGTVPSDAILQSQPRWTWFMNWGEPSAGPPPVAPPTTIPTTLAATIPTTTPTTVASTEPVRFRSPFRAIYENDRALTLEKLPWVKVTHPRVHYPVLK